MARSKSDYFNEAQAAGHVPEDAEADDYSVDQLRAMLGGNVPAWEGSLSASQPIVAPDGHVNLSKEDIEARG